MPKYKIADVVFEFEPKYAETAHWYKPYETTDPLTWEQPLSVSEGLLNYYVKEGTGITPAIAENMALCNAVNLRMLWFSGSYIHSSALLIGTKVYLFSGNSGVGKSTLTRRICRLCPEAEIINDDKPTFRMVDGKCIVYGTPFAGGTDVQLNKCGELGGVFFLEQSENDSVEPLPAFLSIRELLQQTPYRKTEKIAEKLLDMYSEIITRYPFYRMCCTNSDNAAVVALNIINKN